MSKVVYSKKQISPLVMKFNIDVDNNSTFEEIISMFADQTNYQVWAIKAVFGGVCHIDMIKQIKVWADNNQQEIKNLIKGNIVSYTKREEFHQLLREINGLSMLSFVKQVINKFNTHQREMLKEVVLSNISNGIDALTSKSLIKWHEIFKKVESLHKSHKDRLISTSSSLHNMQELENIINTALTESYVWDKDDMLGYISRNATDCEVVYDKDNIVIISVPSFASSSKICGGGRTAWCLTKQESYFNDYVKRHNDATQYFYFDFSLPERDDLAHIGFTIRQGHGITNAHSTTNGSMTGSGISYRGGRISIDQVLANHKIDKSIFMRLRPLKNFKWDVIDFIKMIDGYNKTSKRASIVYQNNNTIIVKLQDLGLVEKLFAHTFINYNNLICNNVCYIMLNFDNEINNSNSVIGIRIEKDKYGVESVKFMLDAFGGTVNEPISFLKKNKIKVSDFVNQIEIEPSILLHKYIDEGCEEEAISLISSKDFDINRVFDNKYPIHKVVERDMINLFRCMVSNKKFDVNVKDHMEEPFLLSMLYTYKSDYLSNKNSSKLKNLKSMIEYIVSLDDFDFNVKDSNFDTAINVAAEYPFLDFVLEKLVNNPKVNVNIVNDFNCTSLGNAIRRSNLNALKILGKRKDLVVREEDFEMAKSKNINLKSYIEPEAFENNTDGLDVCEFSAILAELFAKAFNTNK